MTGLRDIRSPNQYKICVHHEAKGKAINNKSSNKELRKHRVLTN